MQQMLRTTILEQTHLLKWLLHPLLSGTLLPSAGFVQLLQLAQPSESCNSTLWFKSVK